MNNKNIEAVAVDFDGTYVMGKPLIFIYQENKERYLEQQGRIEEARKEAEEWKRFIELMNNAKTPSEWTEVVRLWKEKNPTINPEWVPEHLPINTKLEAELRTLKAQGTKVYLISFSPAELIKSYFAKSKDDNIIFDEIYGTVVDKVKLIKELNCQRYYTDWSPHEKTLKETLGVEVINVEEEFRQILDYNNVELSYSLTQQELNILKEATEHYIQYLNEKLQQTSSREERNKIENKLNILLELKKKVEG